MRYSNKDKFLVLFLCFYLATFPGCSSNPTDSGENAPEIPPQGTMLVDFSFFQNQETNQTNVGDNLLISKFNFAAAVFVVSAFNLAVLVAISIPVIGTAAALSVEPAFESDGKFHWNFRYSEGNITFSFELTAKVNPSTVDWEMFVTTPALDNVLWYDGQSQLDRSSGYWQFYDVLKPTEKHEAAKIDWEYVSDDDRTLTFTNNNTDAPGFGDWLRYQVDGEDVSMLFFKAATSDSVHVEMNKTTGEGYIIAPNYNNGDKACWDNLQNDIACSN